MKTLVFDSGPIISLTGNNLLWILEPLRDAFHGTFLIPRSVYYEIVEHPLVMKRFKFEAYQVRQQLEIGVLTLIDDAKVAKLGDELLLLANNIFSSRGQPLRICQRGEMEALAVSILKNASAVVMDERITRTVVEQPASLQKILRHRFHNAISMNATAAQKIVTTCKNISIIRSVELATIAYERGLLDKYLSRKSSAEERSSLLDSVLWAVKLHGAAVSEDEINEILRIEK